MTPIEPVDDPEHGVKSFVADTLMSVLGTAGGQIIYVATIPILARIYTPEHFGIWALYLALMSVIPVIATLRFDIAVVTARTRKVAGDVMLLTISFSLACGLLLEVLVLLAELIPAVQSFAAAHMSWIVWVPLGVAGTGIYTVGLSWWLRERLYRTITAVRIALPLVSVLLQIAFVVLPDGTGIVVGSAVGQALIAVAVCVMILPAVARRAPPRRLALRGVALLKRFRGLALYTTPYSLQGQIFRHVVVVILVTLGSLETSGFFVMAQRLVYNPLTLIAAALEQATYPRLARSPRNPAIHRLIVATMRRMAILLGFGCALVTVFAHPVVVIVLGETWAPSAPYMVATCYAAASLVVSSWIVRVFDIFGRQKLHLIVDSLCNTAIVLIFVAAFLIWRDPVWAIVAWSAATAAYYAGWVVLAFHIAGMDTRPLISILLAAVAAWSATMLVCLLISRAFGIGILA